jgi:hypothetical protein
MVLGFAGVGFMAYRRRSKHSCRIAYMEQPDEIAQKLS